MARRQLALLHVNDSLIGRWVRGGYLIRRLPGVYAVGHVASSAEAVLTEALLYAGPDAMLTGATGAWWLHVRDHQPQLIEVATPRRCESLPGIRVRERRDDVRTWHRGLPVAPVADVLIDYATTATPRELKRALAQAEYHGYLQLDALVALLHNGRRGGRALRAALVAHDPRLARVKSRLEIDFLEFCARHRLPAPEVNVTVAGIEVDAIWRAQRVVVELDGADNHHTPAQMRRDHVNDLTLRRAGHTVLRYARIQLVLQRGDPVAADLRAALSPAGPSGAPGSR